MDKVNCSPEQWVDIIKKAKRKEHYFVVTEMKNADFLSTAALENAITSRKKLAVMTLTGYRLDGRGLKGIILYNFNLKKHLIPTHPFIK